MAQVNYYQEDKKINPTQQTNKTNAVQQANKSNAVQQANKSNAVQQANISNQTQMSNIYQQSAGNGYVPVADLNVQSSGTTAADKFGGGRTSYIKEGTASPVVKGDKVDLSQPTGAGYQYGADLPELKLIEDKPTQPVTYIDENGEKKNGVAAETEAPEQTTPIEEEISYWDKMRQYYQEMYDAQVAANNTAAANAAAQALENTNRQIEALQQQYAGTNKELYRNYMNQQRLLPQQLASLGYSGGMSESARLRLGTAYQEALNGNRQALANEQTALNAAYTQAMYEAQAAADAANAQALQQRYGYLAQLEGNQYQTEQEQLAQKAQNLAAVGDYSGFLALGYDQAQVDYMTRIWLQEHPDMVSTWMQANPDMAARLGITAPSAGGGYGGGGDKPDPYTNAEYYKAVMTALNAGDTEAAEDIIVNHSDGISQSTIQQAQRQAQAGLREKYV